MQEHLEGLVRLLLITPDSEHIKSLNLRYLNNFDIVSQIYVVQVQSIGMAGLSQ